MDIDDCGVPKTVAFNVAFEGVHKVAVKAKIRKKNLKHETMKHLLVTGGRTWFVYLVRKLPIVTSHEFFCSHLTIGVDVTL